MGTVILAANSKKRVTEKRPRRLSPAGPSCFTRSNRGSGLRSLINALDRLVQRAVELGIRLLRRQAFGQRTREARDHAVLLRQALVSLLSRVAAREGNDFQ